MTGAVAATEGADHRESPELPGRYIVVFEDSVKHPGNVASIQAEEVNGNLGFVYRHALKGYSASMSDVAARAIANNPKVAYVEPDVIGGTAAQFGVTGISRVFATANAALSIDEQTPRQSMPTWLCSIRALTPSTPISTSSLAPIAPTAREKEANAWRRYR